MFQVQDRQLLGTTELLSLQTFNMDYRRRFS